MLAYLDCEGPNSMSTIKEEAKKAVKISRKTFFNPRGWLGYDSLKVQTQAILGFASGIFTVSEPTRSETFEQAMQRLNLTEQSLQQKLSFYLIFATVFALSGVATILFGFWLLIYHKTFSGFVLSIPSAGLLLVNAFRYHFWAFQIKHRKLGCTFAEWRQGKINHGDGTSAL